MHIPRPRRDNRAILPAVIALVLTLAFVAQLLAPSDTELPADATGFVPRRTVPAQPPVVVADPDILARPIFSPSRRNDGGPPLGVAGGDGPGVATPQAGPLEGAVPVGIAAGRGFARLFLQQPDGRVVSLVRGATYRGWRLSDMSQNVVTFTRKGDRIRLPLTTGRVVPSPAAAPETEEQEAQ